MNLDQLFNLAGAFVTLAMVTVVLSSPNTSRVVRSLGNTFQGSLKAAMGRG